MNRVQQPRTLLVLGHNAEMSTAAGADELVEIPTDAHRPTGTKAHPLHLSTTVLPGLSTEGSGVRLWRNCIKPDVPYVSQPGWQSVGQSVGQSVRQTDSHSLTHSRTH